MISDGAAARYVPVHRVRRDQLRGHRAPTGWASAIADNAADVLATLGPPVLGTALAKVVEFAICVSAISALLTCVISSPRTTLSMGSHGALPKAFSRIHPTSPTPAFGTVFFGVAAAVLLAVLAHGLGATSSATPSCRSAC